MGKQSSGVGSWTGHLSSIASETSRTFYSCIICGDAGVMNET
jgi:hypothetical protein